MVKCSAGERLMPWLSNAAAQPPPGGRIPCCLVLLKSCGCVHQRCRGLRCLQVQH